jgi:hypothetical protein
VISLPAQQDRFTFNGTAGQRLLFDTLDIDGDFLNVRLIAPSGNVIWESSANQDFGPFYLTETGPHVLVILGAGDAVGDYRFRVLDMAGASALTLGVTTVGQLNPQCVAAVHSFSGGAGQRVKLQSVSASLPEATWSLVAPAGQTLLSGNIALDLGEALLPDPGSLGPLTKGKTCIGVIARGLKDGKRKQVYIYNICDHEACYREVQSQAISYTTGVPAVVGAIMMLTGKWHAPGVWNMEQFDPELFLDVLGPMGLPTVVVDGGEWPEL